MRTKKILASAFILAALGGGLTAGAAAATTVYPAEGGTWNYGVNAVYTFSNYYHATRVHKSTACSNAGCAYSGWVAKGSTSYATKNPSTLGGNTAFYDVQ